MPCPPRHVVVAMQVAVGDDVQAGTFFVGDHGGERVAELLAIARVHHAGIERPSPHAQVEPAWARPRAGDRGRQDQIFGDGEHGAILRAV